MNMGHGPGLLALVLKLYLVLLVAQGTLAQVPRTSRLSSSAPSPSSGASQSSASSSSSSQVVSNSSSVASTTLSSSSSPSHTRHSSLSTTSSVFTRTDSDTTDDNTAPSSPDFTSSDDPNPPVPTSSIPLPSNSITSSDGATSTTSSPTAIAVLSSHSNSHISIIAGVVAPVCFIILAAIAFVLYKRRQRARDRREWERTHEAIADAVRQVGSPVPRSVAPYAGSGTWSHLTSAKGSGDTMTNPYTDEPVAHQSADQSAALPFRPVRSPTLRSTHSPAFSQTYPAFNVQDDAQSRQSTTDSSVHFQNHPDGHAI
ncbi:hypothetical protein MSAN_00650300 [Mycena sanguinolenta]|uniref:Uncharacterized protein n=1 Tax=Mycena sanguinolenta TaxID=230812 RepID=A0A8H7DG58_9AGAR|nr:hypothetical protein MSAN_00650300 [Mycena sanguinolenta]